MDYELDIIIPRDEIIKTGLSEVLREWGGVLYSSSPAMYVSESNIEFMEITDLSCFDRIIDLKDNKLIALHLKSDIIYDFELYANDKKKQIDENSLLVFLKNLFSLSKFYIILTREDEVVKEKYEISDTEELEAVLLNSVNWDLPADVLLYKK